MNEAGANGDTPENADAVGAPENEAEEPFEVVFVAAVADEVVKEEEEEEEEVEELGEAPSDEVVVDDEASVFAAGRVAVGAAVAAAVEGLAAFGAERSVLAAYARSAGERMTALWNGSDCSSCSSCLRADFGAQVLHQACCAPLGAGRQPQGPLWCCWLRLSSTNESTESSGTMSTRCSSSASADSSGPEARI